MSKSKEYQNVRNNNSDAPIFSKDPSSTGMVRAPATWSGEPFDAARGCDVGQRFGVIREYSALRIRAQRETGLVLDRERCRLCDK